MAEGVLKQSDAPLGQERKVVYLRYHAECFLPLPQTVPFYLGPRRQPLFHIAFTTTLP